MHVIVDTREKINWDFTVYNITQESKKLTAGDYSLLGYEKSISIERKRSTGEIYNNLFKDFKVFKNELAILKDYKVKYIICEFPMANIYTFPERSTIPKYLWSKLKCSSKLFSAKIEEVSSTYEIPFLFCTSPIDAQQKALYILKEFYESVK